jgi:hypothetical protein
MPNQIAQGLFLLAFLVPPLVVVGCAALLLVKAPAKGSAPMTATPAGAHR